MIAKILGALVRFLNLPVRHITREDAVPYLDRYYLLGDMGGLKYFGTCKPRWWQHLTTWMPCVYVHRFLADDQDDELHNHPWEATSLILAGGYREERRADSSSGYRIVEQSFTPGWSITCSPTPSTA
jgi:hypothetical protein